MKTIYLLTLTVFSLFGWLFLQRWQAPPQHIKDPVVNSPELEKGIKAYAEKDYIAARHYFERAIRQKDVEAYYFKGRLFHYGEYERGMPPAYDSAMHYYQLGVDAGDLKANYGLGNLYMFGLGVLPDSIKARHHLDRSLKPMKAASRDNPFWLNNIGFTYARIGKKAADFQKAFKYHLAGALKGDARAQANLADAYYYGRVGHKDNQKAAYWFRKSADQGIPSSMFLMGEHYSYGYGVFQDEARGFRLYKAAADEGYAMAQLKVGYHYASGSIVEQDYQQAKAYFYLSAAQENQMAINSLGWLHENGFGFETTNRDSALIYYRRAANMGLELAKENLARLKEKSSM